MLEWLVRLPHGPRKGLKTFWQGVGLGGCLARFLAGS